MIRQLPPFDGKISKTFAFEFGDVIECGLFIHAHSISNEFMKKTKYLIFSALRINEYNYVFNCNSAKKM